MARILLADDHPLFRRALRTVISRLQPHLAISEAETLAGAKKLLEHERDIVLVMLDLKMSDCDDFSALLSIRSEFPEIPVVVVSSASDADTISCAMTFGAAGFMPKSSTPRDIARAFTAVIGGEIWLPASTQISPVSEGIKRIASLTPGQLQILMGLRRGLRNKEIAREMEVTEKTVRAYTTALFRKLDVKSRTQALVVAQSLITSAAIGKQL